MEIESQPCEDKKERTFQREQLGAEAEANLVSQGPRPTFQHRQG